VQTYYYQPLGFRRDCNEGGGGGGPDAFSSNSLVPAMGQKGLWGNKTKTAEISDDELLFLDSPLQRVREKKFPAVTQFLSLDGRDSRRLRGWERRDFADTASEEYLPLPASR